MKKTTLFQLLDQDGENFAIIASNCDEVTMNTLFTDYMSGYQLDHLPKTELKQIGYPEDLNPDGFMVYLRFNAFKAERILLTEIRA